MIRSNNFHQAYHTKPIPCYTLFIIIFAFILKIVQFRTGLYTQYFQANIRSLLNYHIWTVVTTPFSDRNLSIIILIIITSKTFMARFEIFNASVVLFYQIFAIAVGIQIFTLPLQFSLYFLHKYFYDQYESYFPSFTQSIINSSVGLGAVWINMIYKICDALINDKSGKPQYLKPFFNLDCSFVSRNISLIPYLFFIICLQMSYIGSKTLRYDIIFGFILAIFQCKFLKAGMVKYTLDTYVTRQKWTRYLRMENWKRFVPFIIPDYQQNHLMAIQPLQFYENIANKVKNRHHIVHSYQSYQKSSEDMQNIGLKQVNQNQNQQQN